MFWKRNKACMLCGRSGAHYRFRMLFVPAIPLCRACFDAVKRKREQGWPK